MGKSRQLSPELWPLIDVILFSYIELIFRGGVSCLPAALLFILDFFFPPDSRSPPDCQPAKPWSPGRQTRSLGLQDSP